MLERQSAGSVSAKGKAQLKSGTTERRQSPLRRVQAGELFDLLTSREGG